MTRNHYVFIDSENVGEIDLSRLTDKSVHIFMILGAKQKNLPISYFVFAQERPGQLRIIQTPIEGRNALDFVLTLELGRQLTRDPEGFFHIISKDKGFESVIHHLKSEDKHIARHASLADIPALRPHHKRLAMLKAELENRPKNRPTSRKTLENKIRSFFGNQSDPDFLAQTIETFVKAGLLEFTDNGKVLYLAA